jgi:TPR repeat protein
MYRTHSFAVMVSLLLAAGCGAETPKPATSAIDKAPMPGAGPATGCASKEACYDGGRQAEMANDPAKAKGFYATGCKLGDGESCNEMSVKFSSDPAQKSTFGQKACELNSGAGCFNLAEDTRKAAKEPEAIALYEKSCNGTWPTASAKPIACKRGSVTAFRAGNAEAAARMSQAICNDQFSEGCGVLGVLYVQGKGVTADEAKGRELLHRACEKGDEEACANEKKLGAAVSAPADVPGANVTVASISADGFTLTDLACKSSGMNGLLAGPALASTLGKKKKALDSCAPQGAQVRLRWTAAGGRVTQAEAKSSDPKIEACVVRTMKTVNGVPEGTCATTVNLGAK